MSEKLSPEEIAYICEWTASGNEPRERDDVQLPTACVVWTRGSDHPIGTVTLSEPSLTIAAIATENQQLRAALVQANATAEQCAAWVTLEQDDCENVEGPLLETMRANLARWSKFEDGAKVSRKGNG